MSLARKILGNTFVQFGGKLVTAALSILSLKMITGYLGESGYGNYTFVYTYLALFGIVADFGIFTITVKEMSKKDADTSMILGNALGLRTLLSVVTMILAVVAIFVVGFFFPKYGDTVIPIGVAIAALSTIITLLNGTVSTILQVHLKMQYESLGLVIGKVVSLAYMALVIYLWFTGDVIRGFYQLFWAGVIGNAVILAVTTFYARRYAKIRYRFDFKFWKKLFVMALPYGVALLLSNLYFRIDVVLIHLMLPESTQLGNDVVRCDYALCGDSQAGLYGVAMRFLELLIIIPIYFMNAVLPTMTRYIEQSKERLEKLIQYSFDFLSSLGLPIMIGGILLASPLVQLVSDARFLAGDVYQFGSDTAIRILMFAMFFSFLSNLFGITLVGINKKKTLMWANFVGLMLNLVTNFIVIPRWGFVGAASTSVLSDIIVLTITAYAALTALSMRINFKTSGKALLSGLVMGLAVWSGSQLLSESHFALQLAVLVPLGALVYGGMIWFTKAVTPEMWGILRRK